MADLTPCPFCGATKVLLVVGVPIDDNPSSYVVRCHACWARGPERDTRTEAI